MFFTAAVSGIALADGTSPACSGKKCSNHHHGHKKGSKGPTTNSTGPASNSTGPTK